MTIHNKESSKLILYFTFCTFFLLLLFITFYNSNFFFAYGIEERSLFFGKQFDISSNNGTSKLPQIAAVGNNVYVVWQDNSIGENEIFFTYSSDNGNRFSPVRNLSNNNGTSELPQIEAVGNNVYVVWQDNSIGENEIFFTYSSDNGNRFSPVRNLSNNNGTSELPQIEAVGNNVYVVWQDNSSGSYDVFFRSSSSNGEKFKSARNLSNNNGTSILPQIAVVGNNVYVVWQDNTSGNYDINFKRSPNYGNGFRSANLMNSNGTSELPQVTAAGSNVYVVWQDNTSGGYDVFFQSSLSNGTKFISARNLSNNNGTSELPQIAVSRNDIYVIWRDNDNGTYRIYFKHGQKDNATSMTKFGPLNELNHTGDVSQAKIITGPEFFNGAWTANLNKNNASTVEFYPFMFFEDYSGVSIPLTRLWSNETVSNPDIAVHNTDTYLVWENIGVGNGDIFFKKLSTNNLQRIE